MSALRHVCVLPLSTVLAALAIAHAQSPTGQGIVGGQVIDAVSKRPLGGAVVTLTVSAAAPATPAPAGTPAAPARPRAATAVANAEGRFVFRDVPAGTYALTSAIDNHSGGAYGRRRAGGPSMPLTIAADTRLTNVVLPMWRLASISGVLRDDRGEPVIGTYLTALRRTLNGGRYELGFSNGGPADDRGQYRISGLEPGSYIVSTSISSLHTVSVATVDAFQSAVTSGTATAITREWPLSGALRIATSGLVVDGWQVGVSSGDLLPRPGPNGTVLVHPPVYYSGAPNPQDATVITLGPGEERTGIDFTLPEIQSTRVSGVLRGPAGPASNHGLRLIPVSTGEVAFDVPAAYATTDSAGNFRFLGVRPGSYVIRAFRISPRGPTFAFTPAAAGAPQTERVDVVQPPANPEPNYYAEVPVTVGASPTDGVAVVLQPGAKVSGRIVFDGATQPTAAQAQRVSILLRPLNGQLPNPSVQSTPGATINQSGAFETMQYPPGRYHLEIPAPGPDWSIASIRVGTGDVAGQAFTLTDRDVSDVVITFTDKVIRLSGTVQPAVAGGDPESTVMAFPVDFDAWLTAGMSPRRIATTPVSRDGLYQMTMKLPGDYVVVALPPEVAPSFEPAFLKRVAADGVRISFVAGESKTQTLTVSRVR